MTSDGRPRVWDVIHVVEPSVGGAPAVAAQLARWEAASGLRVCLVGHPDSPAFQPGEAPFDRVALDLSLGLGSVGAARTLARAFAQSRLVHLHSSRAALVGRLANLAARRPTIFTPHGWSWHTAGRRTRGPIIAIERSLAPVVTVLHALSAQEADDASRLLRLGGDRVALIGNGVDLDRFTSVSRPRTAEGRPVELLTIGRLCRQKGQDLLFEALAAFPPGRRVNLTIAGLGPAEAELRARVRSLPDGVTATFAGLVTDPVPLYHRSDLVVFPSRWEGQSLALLEAVATGCPTLATTTSGTSELGDCIATCEVSVAALGELLLHHLENASVRQTLGSAARAQRDQVGEQRVHDRHLALKQRLLATA